VDVANWRPEKATNVLYGFVEASGRLVMKHLMEVSYIGCIINLANGNSINF
jgi:Holliday junction resolvasome RuvABC DNA-binding subunit